jgi:superfamily II DNA or RNA helicase
MTTGLLPLRSYQRGALDAVWADLTKPGHNRVAAVLPTGSGKTVILAHQAAEHIAAHPDERVLILVHTDELVQQTVKKIKDIAPHLDVGIVKAARNEVHAQVIVASVQSLRTEARRRQIRRVGLVIVDECHHATAPTYRAILDHFGCFVSRDNGNFNASAVGFTATLARGDGEGLGSIWQKVSFSRDIAWMVRKRYLIVPRGRRVKVPDLDLSKVASTRADFRDDELGKALADSLAPQLVAQAYAEHAAGRSGIAFFPTVASAYVFADAFNDAGIKTEVVHGALPRDERRAILARLEAGITQVVVNCMVLTEGFDSPRVSCIVVGRPTKSGPLYIQMVGRGLRVDPARPYEDQDCLILDVCGAAERRDLRSLVDLSERNVREPKDGESLLDLEDEFEAGAERDEPEYYTGEVETRDFDPLAARSARTWGRTAAGNFFVPAGKDAYVFLYETAPGTYSVAWRVKRVSYRRYVCCGDAPGVRCSCGKREARRGALTEHRDLDLEMAMAWGEDFAVDMGADPFETFTKKTAPWRRKPASPAARSMARSLGIKVSDEDKIKGGELSDRINRVVASRVIDPLVIKARKAEEAKV